MPPFPKINPKTWTTSGLNTQDLVGRLLERWTNKIRTPKGTTVPNEVYNYPGAIDPSNHAYSDEGMSPLDWLVQIATHRIEGATDPLQQARTLRPTIDLQEARTKKSRSVAVPQPITPQERKALYRFIDVFGGQMTTDNIMKTELSRMMDAEKYKAFQKWMMTPAVAPLGIGLRPDANQP